MNVLLAIVNTLVVILAVFLIALILVQPSKSGGFGSPFGGLGETIFGAHTMSHLSKLTVVCITLFFVLTMLAAIISGHTKEGVKDSSSSLLLQKTENVSVPTDNAQKTESAAETVTSNDAIQAVSEKEPSTDSENEKK